MASMAYVEGYACIHFSWCGILNSACRSHLDFRLRDGLKWSSQRAQLCSKQYFRFRHSMHS
jgi:hypothetical protein